MKGKKKYLWVLWLVILCALLMITGTYAAYISIRNAKSVTVAKTATAEIRFSSNYLYLRERSDSLMPLKMISVSSQGDVSATVTVCNYPQSDLKKVHEENITYTLYAQLRDTAGEALTGDALTQAVAALRINGQAFAADGSLSLTGQTLTGGKASQNVYAVTCAKENLTLLSTLTVEMRAEPDSCPNCAIGSHLLKARLWLSASGNEDGSWSGQFQDDRKGNPDSKKLDGFNYEIYGTAQATMVLSWNPEKVSLSAWSRDELPVASATDSSLTLSLGGERNPTSYRLQFYRVNGIPENETWEDVLKYVAFRPA
jgi:hypothetical protein